MAWRPAGIVTVAREKAAIEMMATVVNANFISKI
jgi:hypothetical protein